MTHGTHVINNSSSGYGVVTVTRCSENKFHSNDKYMRFVSVSESN